VRDAASGGPIGVERAALRYVVVGMFRVIVFFGLFTVLDGLWPLWDPKRQALHDKIAGSVVVRLTAS
ncbi:MAG TPA: RDD family protein, partial [Acidimicrobiia bacterium]